MIVGLIAILVVAGTVAATWAVTVSTRDAPQASRSDMTLVAFSKSFVTDMSTYTESDHSRPEHAYAQLCSGSPAATHYGQSAAAMAQNLASTKVVSTVVSTVHTAIIETERTSTDVPVLVPVWVTWTPAGQPPKQFYYTALLTLKHPDHPCVYDIIRL